MEAKIESTILFDGSTNLCRVCLISSQNNQCIFRTVDDDPKTPEYHNLLEKLQLCGGVEIVENDGLPVGICTKCIAKLNDAHELRKQCQRADIRLRELYGKVIKKQDIRVSAFRSVKDQHCQTDYFFISKETVLDNRELQSHTSNHLVTDTNFKLEQKDDNENTGSLEHQSCTEASRETEQKKMPDPCVIQKASLPEKNQGGREGCRTRRSTMFKRVTSLESLKSHKEWQRNYIKKNINENKIKCDKCDKEFFQLDKLIRHSKLHNTKERPEPVQCTICNKTFRKTDTMVRHLNVHKRANPKEVLAILKEIRDKRKLQNDATHCDNLGESITNIMEENIKNQMLLDQERVASNKYVYDMENTMQPENNTATKNFNCDSARVLISDKYGNVNKLLSSDDLSIYRCQHCDKKYTTEKSLQRHLLIHDEKKFVCTVCNMKFYRQDRLKSHKDRYGHDEEKANIEVQRLSDEKSAIKLINTWIREELDSDNEEKGFPCKICGKSYDTKKSLLKHQVNVHSRQESKCSNCTEECICGGESKSQEKSNQKSKPYSCSECKKTFEKEVKLQKHLRIHERAKEQQDSNFKRFLCHICSKTFRQNTGLMFHMRTHTGYKPHVCKYCGRGFTSNSNCINHERTHTGDRPFVCHFCSAAFAKSCTLKAHITTHTGEANYHCKTCGKSFRRLKYLKEHRFTHTGEKPYACKICGTAYSHSGSLFVHEKKCKVQYTNYQSNTTQQNVQSYCPTQTPSPAITPNVTTLPETRLSNINDTLTTGKTYIDSIQRINSQGATTPNEIITPDLHLHPGTEMSDVPSAVRNFSLISQIFQS